MIVKTDFDTINEIWTKYLWVDRKSKIEPHSAMLLSGEYELKNYKSRPSFFIYMIGDEIAGCNSGHKCCDGTYRSRGLYVFPDHRKKGYGKELLLETINQGQRENAKCVWSYPRQNSWGTYKSAGFELISEWTASDNYLNAYCKINLKQHAFSAI
jgi:GNAT superfamily N-acetyltransferase